MKKTSHTRPQTIGICGAGVMGQGIATVCLLHGYSVKLYDIADKSLIHAETAVQRNLSKAVEKGKLAAKQLPECLERLTRTTELSYLKDVHFLIEAIIEDKSAKIALFQQLETLLPPEVIIATNTSSISISSLQSELRHPERFVGLHFFNPAHIMKLVEVISGAFTSKNVIDICRDFALSIGKNPVFVQDVPGFLVNRVARNFYNEALRLVEEGGASIEQVDRIMRGCGFRMGPFELMDLIGVDTNFAVTRSIWEQYFYEPRFAPSSLQKRFVDAKLWGRKTGQGFYHYSDAEK